MRRAAALLAAVACLAAAGCGGGDGAEPGASSEATLVLDFQANAVHAGIYAAIATGELERRGVELTVREPSASTDAPRLLRSGRAELAVMDIHDLAIARERGIDAVAFAPLVQVPLAAVIAGDAEQVEDPADLEGSRVGVTGLPSDDAVLAGVLEAGGLTLEDVSTVTIGFNSVPAIAAGRVDAATAFWNAEGVELRRRGIETRELRIGDFGAPPYPELVLVAMRETLDDERGHRLVDAVAGALGAGTELVVSSPEQGLQHLLDAVPGLDRASQRAQLDALLEAGALDPEAGLEREVLERWARWEARMGIVEQAPAVDHAFDLPPIGASGAERHSGY